MQDQYINHIMNETGATVLLRGRGSGNSEGPQSEGERLLIFVVLDSSKCVVTYPSHSGSRSASTTAFILVQ